MRTPIAFLLLSSSFCSAETYALSSESTTRNEGVQAGTLTAFEFNQSKVFEGTTRGCWLYVPNAYNGEEPAALMVFQDGHAYVSEDGQIRIPIVFDNLIAQGEMPVTIALFVNPGHKGPDKLSNDGWAKRSNRSIEYDTPSPDYATFLVEELIPHVVETHDLKISPDPAMRAICGMSSGGICAWTAAWERPEQFGKVLSHIGSFTNIRGGHVYPALIRKTDRKAIRVFLQDGENDLNNAHGSWPIANQQMASALAFAGYDHRFVYGHGAHSGLHGGAILPESLRWLWRDGHATSKSPQTQEANWELVGEGYQFTDGACAHPDGSVFFSDLPTATLYRLGPEDAQPQVWFDNGPRISGMDFAADGALYAAVQGEGDSKEKRIVRIDPQTKVIETVAKGVNPNDIIVAKSGQAFFTDTRAGTVNRVPLNARDMPRPPVVAGGILKPNGIALSPDHSTLYVSEYGGTHLWRFPLDAHGNLRGGERLSTLAKPESKADSGGDGMATAGPSGHLYITSHLGIQIVDAHGASQGILPKPQDKATVSVAVIKNTVFACSADRFYRASLK